MRKLILITILLTLMTVPAMAIPSLGGWSEGDPGTTHAVFGVPGAEFTVDKVQQQSSSTWIVLPNDDVINPNPSGVSASVTADVFTAAEGDFFGHFETDSMITVDVSLPNYENPDGYKELWFTVDATGDLTDVYVTALDGGALSYSIIQEDSTLIGIRISPNPTGEILHFGIAAVPGGEGDGSLEDGSMVGALYGFHIDTICTSAVVPAPGAVLLGGIGVCLVGWLRKFKSL